MKQRTLGEAIANAREERGWQQTTLAEFSGVSQAQISTIESGDCPNPGIITVSAIAHALGLAVGDLFPRKNRRTKKNKRS